MHACMARPHTCMHASHGSVVRDNTVYIISGLNRQACVAKHSWGNYWWAALIWCSCALRQWRAVHDHRFIMVFLRVTATVLRTPTSTTLYL
jgi:hypothetical protein